MFYRLSTFIFYIRRIFIGSCAHVIVIYEEAPALQKPN